MKLKTSIAGFTPWFLRRMTAWCAKEIELPMRQVKVAVFRNSRSLWGGCARCWRGQITLCVAKVITGPHPTRTHRNRFSVGVLADRMEILIHVTAHELAHIYQYVEKAKTRIGGSLGGGEEATDHLAAAVLAKFRQERDALLNAWNVEPAQGLRGPVLSVTERRALKAQKDLDRWQRRLKLAQTKVRKLKRRVAYYQQREE